MKKMINAVAVMVSVGMPLELAEKVATLTGGGNGSCWFYQRQSDSLPISEEGWSVVQAARFEYPYAGFWIDRVGKATYLLEGEPGCVFSSQALIYLKDDSWWFKMVNKKKIKLL